jgi:hypothetical protein
MFGIGSFRTQTCSGMPRCSFLCLGAFVPLVLGMEGTIGQLGAVEPVRARSVLFDFLWGSPGHLDTLDPKPDDPPE